MIIQAWYYAKILVQCDGEVNGKPCPQRETFLGDSLSGAITQARNAGWKLRVTCFCPTCPVNDDLKTNLEISPGPDGFPIWRRLRGGPVSTRMP